MNREQMQLLKSKHGLEPLVVTNKSKGVDEEGVKTGKLFIPQGPEQLKPYKIDVDLPTGKLLWQGKPLNTDDYGIVGYEREKREGLKRKEFKILVNQDGDIHGVPQEFEGMKYKHSSLLGAEWPLISGTLETKNGCITELTNRSGHFVPSPDAQNALVEYMQNIGATLDQLHPNNGHHILNSQETAIKLEKRGGRSEATTTPSEYRGYLAIKSGKLSIAQGKNPPSLKRNSSSPSQEPQKKKSRGIGKLKF